MVDADVNREFEFSVIFTGVEPVLNEYKEKCEASNISWSYIKKKPGITLSYSVEIFRSLLRSDAQILMLHNCLTILEAWFAKKLSMHIKKIVVRETHANHLKIRIEWVRLYITMLLADKLVYLSKEYCETVQKRVPFIYRSKHTAVIPNGLDVNKFRPVSRKGNEIIQIGMQSRLVRIKDHKTLFKALRIMLDEEPGVKIHLRIAGDGDYIDELKSVVNELALEANVEFVGVLGQADLIDFLNELDIYVHATLGETMSTAIMQAMACGLPIIASDVGGVNNMIENGKTGLLVPAQNWMSMSIAIKRLIHEKKLRNDLAAAGRHFAEDNYANTIMLQRYRKVFFE